MFVHSLNAFVILCPVEILEELLFSEGREADLGERVGLMEFRGIEGEETAIRMYYVREEEIKRNRNLSCHGRIK